MSFWNYNNVIFAKSEVLFFKTISVGNSLEYKFPGKFFEYVKLYWDMVKLEIAFFNLTGYIRFGVGSTESTL